MEKRLENAYAELKELAGIPRLRKQKEIDTLETQLSFQGANPKNLDFEDLVEHVRAPHNDDAFENKYQARIKNRATAIRAYCIQCQGADSVGVRECASLTCPLHPFRMGKDPFRGWELPAAAPVVIEDEEEDVGEFEEGDEGAEADASD